VNLSAIKCPTPEHAEWRRVLVQMEQPHEMERYSGRHEGSLNPSHLKAIGESFNQWGVAHYKRRVWRGGGFTNPQLRSIAQFPLVWRMLRIMRDTS
jgi:hypothetical protein